MIESTIHEITEGAEVIGIGTSAWTNTNAIAVWNGSHTVNIYHPSDYSEIDMFTFGHALTDQSAKRQKAIEHLKERGYTVFTKE